jgi:hypothetical protein
MNLGVESDKKIFFDNLTSFFERYVPMDKAYNSIEDAKYLRTRIQ